MNPMGLVDQLLKDFVTQMYEGIFLETGRTSLLGHLLLGTIRFQMNHVFKPEFYCLLHL